MAVPSPGPAPILHRPRLGPGPQGPDVVEGAAAIVLGIIESQAVERRTLRQGRARDVSLFGRGRPRPGQVKGGGRHIGQAVGGIYWRNSRPNSSA